MPVTIIAEAGVNHNGSLEMAKEMARVAKECGADIVKYQTAVPELVVSKFAEKAEYQKQTTDAAESQLEMIRKLHFSFEAHKELKGAVKNAIKRTDKAVLAGDKEMADKYLKDAIKALDNAKVKGLVHKNKVDREKSRLTKKVNNMEVK